MHLPKYSSKAIFNKLFYDLGTDIRASLIISSMRSKPYVILNQKHFLNVLCIKMTKVLGLIVSIFILHKRLPSRYEMSLRDFNQISIERDISKTSPKYLKRDGFFVTSLRSLKYISKKMSFLWRLSNVSKTSQKRCLLCDVFKTSRTYFKKDVFSVTCLRLLKNISRKYFWFYKNTSQQWVRVISVSLLQ